MARTGRSKNRKVAKAKLEAVPVADKTPHQDAIIPVTPPSSVRSPLDHPELVHHILSFLDCPSTDLATCLRVNKTFFEHATTHLYRKVSLNFRVRGCPIRKGYTIPLDGPKPNFKLNMFKAVRELDLIEFEMCPARFSKAMEIRIAFLSILRLHTWGTLTKSAALRLETLLAHMSVRNFVLSDTTCVIPDIVSIFEGRTWDFKTLTLRIGDLSWGRSLENESIDAELAEQLPFLEFRLLLLGEDYDDDPDPGLQKSDFIEDVYKVIQSISRRSKPNASITCYFLDGGGLESLDSDVSSYEKYGWTKEEWDAADKEDLKARKNHVKTWDRNKEDIEKKVKKAVRQTKGEPFVGRMHFKGTHQYLEEALGKEDIEEEGWIEELKESMELADELRRL